MCMLRLTLEQKELCRSRLKLLSYLDRLATYEVTTITRYHSSILDESLEILQGLKMTCHLSVDNPK